MAEQPDYSDSCMLAIYPPADVAAALAIPGGLDTAGLHVTVAYTGNADDVDIRQLTAAAIDAAQGVRPFTAQISGAARFTGGEKDVAVALIDAPELEDLRAAVRAALDLHGIDLPREHGYCAHLSRAYLAENEPDPGRLAPLTFPVGALSVVHGTTRIDVPLAVDDESHRHTSLPLAEQARAAYAEGWARTGGPMTDRVKAGCIAAVELACEHPNDPGVLETTLRLGLLEGTWAKIFERRDELMAKQTAILTAAWRDATARLDAAVMVNQVRVIAGLAEANDPSALARAKQAAKDAALTLLAWLPASAGWQRLRDAMRSALRSGRAEGVADAIAIAGQAVGEIGIDFDLAFTDAYAALANLGQIWADADGWLGKMLGRAADDLGRALGDLAASGASYEDMLTAAQAILDGMDGDAVSFITDWALQTALARGALDLYASENVTAVSWVSAGDSRVCSRCDSNEADSPYAPSDFPSMPDHPRCRCVPSADVDLTRFAQYFT